jgi:branched-chain amino acid transport system substrate-binding protein
MKKLFVILVLLLAAVFAFAGGGSQGSAPAASGGADDSWNSSPTVRLGVAVTLSGTQSNPGIQSHRGMEIAVEQINAAGGINGKRVEVFEYDDKGQPAEALKAVTRLIEQDKVHAIWGPLSSNSMMGSGEYIQDAGVPAMGPAVGIVWLAQGWDYIFRATANSRIQTETAFDFMKKKGYKNIGYFNINEEYGNNSVKDMDTLVNKDGTIKVTVREMYKDGDTDFTAQSVKIAQANPDCLYVVAWSNDCGQLIKQLRAAGYDKPVFGDNSFTAKPLRDIAGPASNNCFLTAAYILPDKVEDIDTSPAFARPVINQYLKYYVKKYGGLPNEDNAYRSYDGVSVILKAIGNAKSLRGDKIRDAIHAISDHEGNIGVMNFARFPNGECVDKVNVWEIKDSQVIPCNY